MDINITSVQVAPPKGLDNIEDLVRVEETDEDPFRPLPGSNITPIRRLTNLVFTQAIKDNATKIVFQSNGNSFSIKYLVDGNFYEMSPPPKQLFDSVTQEIELLFGVKKENILPLSFWEKFMHYEPVREIVENKKFLDGDFVYRDITTFNPEIVQPISINLNLTKFSSEFGKHYNVKLFYPQKYGFSDELKEDQRKTLEGMIRSESGLILIAAQQGMGKTTISSDLLRYLEHPAHNAFAIGRTYAHNSVHTLGISQTNPKYESIIRSVKNLHPTLISFDDISDPTTAQEAIGLANRGALVLGFVSAYDASSALNYLISLDVEPNLIGQNLRGIISQTLVKKIHQKCKSPCEVAQIVNDKQSKFFGQTTFNSNGCSECNDLGYKGRVPIRQILGSNEISGISQSLKRNEIKSIPNTYAELAEPLVRNGEISYSEYERLKTH